MTTFLASAALNPVINFVVFGGLIFLGIRLTLFPAVIALLCTCITYIVVGPRVQRSKALWPLMFPSRAAGSFTSDGDRNAWIAPVLIITHQFSKTRVNRLMHTLSTNCVWIDNAVFCVPASRAFHMPLSRVVLYLLGGVVPYSRVVIAHLLTPRSKPAGPVVLACPDAPTVTDASAKLVLASKGPFAAALKSGASIVPCVTIGGKVYFGAVVQSGAPVQTPSPDAIVQLATRYGTALETLYNKNKPATAPRVSVKA